MKLYVKMIAPVIYSSGKKKYIEDPIHWYPEEMEDELWEKYRHLNTFKILSIDDVIMDMVSIEPMYVEYIEQPTGKIKRDDGMDS